MIRVQGSIPYPPTANSIPIRQFAASLRQLSSGLQQAAGELTGTTAAAASSWTGDAARAFAGHVSERSRTVRTVGTELTAVATTLDAYAAAIDTTSAAYTTAATAEHAARGGLPWTAAALAAAIAAESAAYGSFVAAGAACKAALWSSNMRIAGALFLGVDASAFSSITGAVGEVWTQVSDLFGDDEATDADRAAATQALDVAMWETIPADVVSRASDPTLDQVHGLEAFGLAGGAFGVPVRCGSFADEIRGGADPLDGTLAALNGDAYRVEGWQDGGRIGEWRRVTADELPPGLVWQNFENANWYSGMRAALYTDDDGRYVLSFAGWNDEGGLGVASDALNSVDQGLAATPYQFDQALELGRRLSAAYGENLVITGHSLGGALAAYTSLGTGAPAVTFNAAGVHPDNVRALTGLDGSGASEVAAANIRNYRVAGDILTNLQEDSVVAGAMPDAIGRQIHLRDTAPATPFSWSDPWDSGRAAVDHGVRMHQMDSVVEALDAQRPWESAAERCTPRPGAIIVTPPSSTTVPGATDHELGTAPWFRRTPATTGGGGR